MFIVACLGVASSEGDGQRRWNVSDERVTMSVVSLPHAAVDCWWQLFVISRCCATVRLLCSAAIVQVLKVIDAASLMPIGDM